MQVLPGVDLYASESTPYTMTYPDFSRGDYDEVFALLRLGPVYMGAVSAQVEAAILQLAAQALAIPPPFGPAIAALVGIGGNWLWAQQLNSDGSLTLQFAHHYYGTKFRGVDPTFWPFPGVDQGTWQWLVDGLIETAGSGVESDAAEVAPEPGFEARMPAGFLLEGAEDPESELRRLMPAQGSEALREQVRLLRAVPDPEREQRQALDFVQGELEKRGEPLPAAG